MKKIIYLSLMIGLLALTGCKKSTACWYPINGGYINIDNVSHITTNAELLVWTEEDVSSKWDGVHINKDTLISDVITEATIEAAIQKLKKATKTYTKANANASIFFDNFNLTLPDTDGIPNGWQNNESLIKLLKMWLDAKKDVDSML
jgi:hypothetical protein